MIPISIKVAIKILLDGTKKGFSVGYVNKDKSTEYSIYIREYDNFTFTIAEDETKNEYFALENIDTFEPTANFEELSNALKDGPRVLSEVVTLLKKAQNIDMIRNEALVRMKILKLHPNVINEFKNENKLNRSEFGMGILYWLTDDEKQLVKDFEKEYEGYIVYHVIKTNTVDFGVVYDLLYVSPQVNEWVLDREKLKDNIVMSYTVTECAECGPIQIKMINGGLARTF